MGDNGNVIGSHSVTHPVMSKLNRDEQLFQIKDSFLFLNDLKINSEKTYCHPYGGFHSFNEKRSIYLINKVFNIHLMLNTAK